MSGTHPRKLIASSCSSKVEAHPAAAAGQRIVIIAILAAASRPTERPHAASLAPPEHPRDLSLRLRTRRARSFRAWPSLSARGRLFRRGRAQVVRGEILMGGARGPGRGGGDRRASPRPLDPGPEPPGPGGDPNDDPAPPPTPPIPLHARYSLHPWAGLRGRVVGLGDRDLPRRVVPRPLRLRGWRARGGDPGDERPPLPHQYTPRPRLSGGVDGGGWKVPDAARPDHQGCFGRRFRGRSRELQRV